MAAFDTFSKSFLLVAGVVAGSAAPAFANDDGDRLGNVTLHTVNDMSVLHYEGYKEPSPDHLSLDVPQMLSDGTTRDALPQRIDEGRVTAYAWHSAFDHIARLGDSCTSSEIYFDSEINMPQGTYFLTSAHCVSDVGANGRTLDVDRDEIFVRGSYLDDDGKEQRYFLSNPHIFIPRDYDQVNFGQTSYISKLANEGAILFFPDRDLPEQIVPKKFVGFDGDPVELKGVTLSSAGYDSRLFGLSFIEHGCKVVDVGDIVSPFGSDSELINVLDTDCPIAPGASGSPAETLIDGEQVVVGVASASFVELERSYVSYLSNDHLEEASELFNTVVGRLEAVDFSEKPMCARVEVDGARVRASQGTDYQVKDTLRVGSVLQVFSQASDLEFVDGYSWAHVGNIEGDFDGYIAEDFLSDWKLCSEMGVDPNQA